MKPIYCPVCKEPIVTPEGWTVTDVGPVHDECFKIEKQKREYKKAS